MVNSIHGQPNLNGKIHASFAALLNGFVFNCVFSEPPNALRTSSGKHGDCSAGAIVRADLEELWRTSAQNYSQVHFRFLVASKIRVISG